LAVYERNKEVFCNHSGTSLVKKTDAVAAGNRYKHIIEMNLNNLYGVSVIFAQAKILE